MHIARLFYGLTGCTYWPWFRWSNVKTSKQKVQCKWDQDSSSATTKMCMSGYLYQTFVIINENVFKDHWLMKEITDKSQNGRPTYNP